MATIEVKSKYVADSDTFGKNHLYYVYTLNNGDKFVLRGGPQSILPNGGTDGLLNSFTTDNISAHHGTYIDVNSYDWDNHAPNSSTSHKDQTIFTGTDAEVLAKVQPAIDLVNSINTEWL